MSKLLAVLMCAMLFVAVGCKAEGEVKDNDSDKTMSSSSTSTKTNTSGGVDDCSHCAGNQVANADGTCPVCHMKVK